MSEKVVPDGWEVKSLSELVSVDRESLKNSTDPDYEFYYIDIASVRTGVIDKPSNKIKFYGSPSRAKRVVRQNDVLLSTVRPNLKAFAYVKDDFDDFYLNELALCLESEEILYNLK